MECAKHRCIRKPITNTSTIMKPQNYASTFTPKVCSLSQNMATGCSVNQEIMAKNFTTPFEMIHSYQQLGTIGNSNRTHITITTKLCI